MDEHNHSYGNGSTQPPKSHGGIIAVLLVLVILLGGISSALGILNIRLFSMLEDQKGPDGDFHFAAAPSQGSTLPVQQASPTVPAEILDALRTRLGVEGEEVSGFYQHYYRLPAGLLITSVEDSRSGGLQSGDIIMRINGTRVKSPQEAAAALEKLSGAEPLTLALFRSGREITIEISQNAGE